MKNSKREITLNEKDSVSDVLVMQKLLLDAYGRALFTVRKKEIRRYICDRLGEIGEEIFFLKDLIK